MPPEDRHSGVPGGGGGANVKTGERTVGDGQQFAVTFGTAFASTPRVVACINDALNADDTAYVKNVTITGFSLGIFKGHGGSGHTWTVNWIATDVGDP